MKNGRKNGSQLTKREKVKRWRKEEVAGSKIHINPRNPRNTKEKISVSVQQMISMLIMLEPDNSIFKFLLKRYNSGTLEKEHRHWIATYYTTKVSKAIEREKSRK